MTNRLHTHSPVYILQPKFPTVPSVLHVHGSQPNVLFASKFQNPSEHVSHRRPPTFILQWHRPATFSSSVIESQIPSSVEPRGSQSQPAIEHMKKN